MALDINKSDTVSEESVHHLGSSMTLLLIACVWLLVVALVVSLCGAAGRGDRPQAEDRMPLTGVESLWEDAGIPAHASVRAGRVAESSLAHSGNAAA